MLTSLAPVPCRNGFETSLVAAAGHMRRGDAVRVMECILLHVLAGPLVCVMFPCMAAQQTAMLDMRDANPTIIRPPFDPMKVCLAVF